MDVARGVRIDGDVLAEFCRAHGIRRLALFGSALAGNFGPNSDIDLLVEFEPNGVTGLIRLAAMELELEGLLGREVELRTGFDLSSRLRDKVVTSARTLSEAA